MVMGYHLLSFFVILSIIQSSTCEQQISALSIVENSDKEDNEVTVEEVEEIQYDKNNVFHPTKDWQTVQEGQAVPGGLHIRMNLQTGEREAKLMDGDNDAKYWKLGDRQGMVNADKKSFTREELKRALKDFKSEAIVNPNTESVEKFRSYKELKEDFEKLNMGVKTDVEIIQELMKKLNQEDLDNQSKTIVLTDLEYYLHQIDNAVFFCDEKGLEILLKYLNNTNEDIRSETALVLGSALQSNPKAQISAMETGLMIPLIRILSLEKSVTLRKRYLYALSSLIRHFPYAQLKFLEQGGLSVFSQIFEETGNDILKVKIVSLLNDLLTEKKLTLSHPLETDMYKEKLKQYNQLHLEEELVQKGWCKIIPTLLHLTDHDSREKVINAMTTLLQSCSSEFVKSKTIISQLLTQYKQLASADEDGDDYYSGLHNSLTFLVQSFPKKDEL